jgi:site-specific DNA-methyltransferase (adenine-specific)
MGTHLTTHPNQPAIATADLFDKLRPYLPEVPEEIERLVAERTGIEWSAYKNREVVGQTRQGRLAVAPGERRDRSALDLEMTAPATPAAERWQGWGTALKPAHEPIVVARKPLVGTVAANVLEWGTGALNIDGSRIAVSDNDPVNTSVFHDKPTIFIHRADPVDGTIRSMKPPEGGRWPANVLFDEEAAQILDEKTGVSKSPATYKRNVAGYGKSSYPIGEAAGTDSLNYGDSGGASRFFYVAKASKRDRNEGLEDLEARVGENGNKWTDQDYRRGDEAPVTAWQNFHPTVKPTELMRYLVKLVTPPGGAVLDPFTGSGSTGKATILEGFDFVGVELTEEYLPIIEGRLKWALENRDEGTLF